MFLSRGILVSLFALVLGGGAYAADPDADFFEARVRPILVESCVRCHGPNKASGGLRVDSRDALLKGGESGPALVVGDPAASLLMKAVRRDEKVAAMPPDKSLKASTVADFEKWVRKGAVWPANAAAVQAARHWAFEPVRVAQPPRVDGATQSIDAFLTAKLREKKLTPNPLADKRTLIRRAAFDLTGLPPTPEEVETFLKDDSPTAYAKLVDRLLESPRYGEKWGRHWLDVVRYADTAGETADFPIPDAWRYRNWVIEAFNTDLPYDQFVRAQLAGDILASRLPADASPKRYEDLITATGYIAVARRFGFDPLADHYLTIEDTIDTFGKSFLGLTIGCARCHDHKYDPISAADYYALYGFFESTRYPYSGAESNKKPRDSVPLTMPQQVAQVSATLPGLVGGFGTVRPVVFGPHAYAVWEGNGHDAQLHKRGDPQTRGNAIPRRFLTILGGQTLPSGTKGSGRLELAGWIADPKNPLTARVMANRIWAGHFGTGLVATPSDFGTRGSPPSHPELLDWLAGEFVKSGWSIKAMHRTIMLSDAYRRTAASDDANARVDANNVYLWRFPRRRLTAEEVRDSLLAVSGDLDTTPGEAHPFPDTRSWGFTQHNPFVAVYDTNRRSVYLMTQRIKRHPFLALFDGPDPNASAAGRQTTTVPTQALFFLNDPFVHARAKSLAGKLLALPEAERLDRAYRLLYGRPPGDRDREIATRFLTKPSDEKAAWTSWLRVMFGSNEFIYVD